MATQTIVPSVPFVDASHEHTELGATQTFTPTTTTQTFSFDVPSYGFLRNMWINLTATGGTGGTVAADGPFNIIQSISLLDTNGAPIYGPLDGYSLYLSNLVGGYAFNQDPTKAPSYSNTTTTPGFSLRVPVEISHYNGMGSLSNQNSAAPYKLQITVNTVANAFATAPSPVPAYTMRLLLEAWSLPNNVDAIGRPQEQIPPNHGTVQYWSSRTQTGIVAGNNTVKLERLGSLIRNLIFVARDGSGVRSNGVLPQNPIFNWDARQLNNDYDSYRKDTFWESTSSLTAATLPAGVYVYSFNRSQLNRSGDDSPSLWLPTVQATRLELTGTFQGSGSVQVITNDIAPVEVNPANRYVENSATGFHPNPDIR